MPEPKAIDSESLLLAQRRLRSRLLDNRQSISLQPGRDLAAELLLYLDEPVHCWRVGAQWVRERLDADRVDGGYAVPGLADYRPVGESLRADRFVPSISGRSLNIDDQGVAVVWGPARLALYEDVAHDGQFGPDLRAQLGSLGTRTKVAVSLYDGEKPVGLMCADWLDIGRRVNTDACYRLGAVGREVLGPVLAAAWRLAQPARAQGDEPDVGDYAQSDASHHRVLCRLTPAELRLARLIVTGRSYKEAARHLGRSFSTVDHQLRSIRGKLNVRSTAQLVHLLSADGALGGVEASFAP